MMSIGNRIAQLRQEKGLTQEALAQQLGVTNQAVSKWESDQCCPDVALLPRLADLFGITLDELFGRAPEAGAIACPGDIQGPDWPEDGSLRVVLYLGRKLVKSHPAAKDITFTYQGPALNVTSAVSVSCGDVGGDVDAGTCINCGNVAGHANAGTAITCGNVLGNVDAGTEVRCEHVEGSVDAGMQVTCGDVGGDVDAGTDVQCGNVKGSVDAGVNVTCGDVGGDVDAGCNVECGAVSGDIDAGGMVQIRR